MSENFQYAVLALIQGLTEFLPISSSAHLLLPSQLLGWPDQGLAFDIAVHVGSLVAVIVYFRGDIFSMTVAWIGNLGGKGQTADSHLAWMVIIATIPAGVAGIAFSDLVETHLRSAWVIAAATLLFGLLLGLADYRRSSSGGLEKITMVIAIIVGFAQALAVIPGTSRSGITMTAALFCGLSRHSAARFSFLMSIPIIAAAGLLKTVEMVSQNTPVDWLQLLFAAGLSAVTAFACIGLFMRLIDRLGFMPFVLYRIFLSFLIIIFIS